MEKQNQQGEDKTAFNMGLAYLQRIDDLLKICNEASLRGDLKVWYLGVNVLFREIYPKMNYKEVKEYNSIVYGTYNKIQNMKKRGEMIDVINEKKLTDGELFLRKIMDKKGLLMPSKEDVSQSIIG